MKNVLLFFTFLILASCTQEEFNAFEKNTDDVKVINRMPPENWCDGTTLTDPAFFEIISSDQDLVTGLCCIDFKTCGPSTIRLYTSNYNFNNNSGSQTGEIYETSLPGPGWGIGTICFEPLGTHFAVEVTCNGLTRCFVFSNDILNC